LAEEENTKRFTLSSHVSVTAYFTMSYKIMKKTERVGFNLPSFCNLIKNLYLRFNSSDDKDLSDLFTVPTRFFTVLISFLRATLRATQEWVTHREPRYCSRTDLLYKGVVFVVG
jgi:hypothetical protein